MRPAEVKALRSLVAKAHRKIGASRKIVDAFWRRRHAAAPYDRDTAWAMHVALVQLAEVLSRGRKS